MKNLFGKAPFIIFAAALMAGACAPLSFSAEQKASMPGPLTLEECYELALKRSEIIAIDAEVIKEAEAHFLQALGEILPHVHFISTIGRKDGGGGGSTSSSGNSSQRAFNLKQTLFSGFKEFAGMRGGSLEKKQRVYEKARAEQLLFGDVSDAFYLLIEQRADLRVLRSVRKVYQERLKDLNARLLLGRSRSSELVNVEAQLYQADAEIQAGQSQEAIARQLLEFLVGRPVGAVIDTGLAFPTAIKQEDDYLLKVDLRPDVQAAGFASDVAQQKFVIARSDLFPTISAESNYYTHRTAPATADWDATLTFDVPLFDGTTTFGNIKEAKARSRESDLTAQRIRRLAIQDIRDSYVRFVTARERSRVLRKVYRASSMNYMLQAKDYEYNLVNNLDVLDSIRSLQDSRRSYIQAYYEEKRFYWQLRVATGESPLGS